MGSNWKNSAINIVWLKLKSTFFENFSSLHRLLAEGRSVQENFKKLWLKFLNCTFFRILAHSVIPEMLLAPQSNPIISNWWFLFFLPAQQRGSYSWISHWTNWWKWDTRHKIRLVVSSLSGHRWDFRIQFQTTG